MPRLSVALQGGNVSYGELGSGLIARAKSVGKKNPGLEALDAIWREALGGSERHAGEIRL